MEVRTSFSKTQIDMLINILNVKNCDNMSITKLSELINTKINNKLFWELAKYLREINILEKHENIAGNVILLKIHHKQLERLIRQQEYINWLVHNYFLKQGHIIAW